MSRKKIKIEKSIKIKITKDLRLKNVSGIAYVYFLKHKSNIVYIGCSTDVIRRISVHLSEGLKNFDDFETVQCSFENMYKEEEKAIKLHKPKYNINHKIRKKDTYIRLRLEAKDKQLIEEAAGKGNVSRFIVSASIAKAKRDLAKGK